ncbi:MAG: YhjD/YihY/BrkB family envelope integrity protein [Thermoanaerobaculia bacterium]
MVTARRRAALAFLHRLFRKANQDSVPLRSSALAFSTLLSLVPLLAVISTFIAQGFRESDGKVIDLLVELLPYREESIEKAIYSFVGQADALSNLGLLGFLVASLSAFFGVESAFHRIWRVEGRRQLGRRLVSFSILLFWGPLLIGAGYSLLLWLRQHARVGGFGIGSMLVQLIPVATTFIGLAMLFWLIPTRKVLIRHAAIGSLVATVGLELLKVGFRVYVEHFTAASRVVYGGFVFALLFVISLQLAWWILLMGCEVAACLALPVEAERRPHAGFRPDPWAAILVLRQLGERFGTRAPGLNDLESAALYGVDGERLRRLLEPLIERGLIVPPVAPSDGYRLAIHPGRVRLDHLLEPYEPGVVSEEIASQLPPDLAALARKSRANWAGTLGDRTLADLIAAEGDAEPELEGDRRSGDDRRNGADRRTGGDEEDVENPLGLPTGSGIE